ncbi:MAG: thiamine phosphate synthase, partial [Acetobacteraceae bacterium]|nr:thiamine phosphate synthase [Acetobacteraceae bacterium]
AAAAATGAALHLAAAARPDWARASVGPDRLIGRSAHAQDPLTEHAVSGLDYVTLSPIRLSASKPGYGPALGYDGLAASVAASAVPVIALGGIETAADARASLSAGAAGVAIMGAVMRAADPQATVSALLAAVRAAAIA